MLPLWFVRPLVEGDVGEDVRALQQILGLQRNGVYDSSVTLTVRGAQSMLGLDVTGVVDEATAEAIGPRAQDRIPPSWWARDLYPGEPEYALVAPGGEASIRRLQGNYGINPTGIIDEQTALILGARGVDHG